jgi:NADPH2:quinone reductase
LIGFQIAAYQSQLDLIVSSLTDIIGLTAAGKLSVQVGSVLPLSQASEAHLLLEFRKTTGKVVL